MFETRDYVGQRTARGFQVALHAHIELPLARQTRGVDDRAANGFHRGVSDGGFHVRTARSVAALAIDPFGQFRREYSFLRDRRAGVGIVAE